MILNHGSAGSQQILKPETVDLMAGNAIGDCQVTMLHTVAPGVSNDAEFFPGMSKGWGLSFMINNEQADTGRPAGSLAWAGLANTYFWIDLTNGVGGVYATQIFPFADIKSLPLFLEFETIVYQS
jgi:methyl acetate hydrolase